MSVIISNMRPGRERYRVRDSIPGSCAKCGRLVYESESTLDDAYAVWWGKCPYCGALNALDTTKGIRGYSSAEMCLTLPEEEEVIMNDLPADTPTKGWHDPVNKGKTKEELVARYG
jgi:phage FluMu protein Com